VKGAGWDHGIAPEVFAAFAADLERDPRAALARFLVLQARGDEAARDVLRYLQAHALRGPAPQDPALAAALALLGNSDMRDTLAHITQPALVVHGTRDALVPAAAAHFLRRELPDATLVEMDGAAHAPFARHAPRLARAISEFVREH
jgi:pimeloyl-[acyl-carrier protein] methyl ester esterase